MLFELWMHCLKTPAPATRTSGVCLPPNFTLLPSKLRLHAHLLIIDVPQMIPKAPQAKPEPEDSVGGVGNASGVLPAQEDNQARPNNESLEQLEIFKHDLLEYHGSKIRLVKVRPPKGAESPVECDIRIASTSSDYICLSYVWGDREPGEWILLNGKKFWSRQNLFHFLTSARSLVDIRSNWIWIDALCIDQENIEEREHQVKRMGQIYSRASRVVSWFGSDGTISLFLHFAQARRYNYVGGLVAFCMSPYWKRAWITQEIALARRISFMACQTILDSDQLPSHTNTEGIEPWTEFKKLFTYLRAIPRETPLFQLLSRSLDKECQIPRDRVFSLLALCRDGIYVDVDYTAPDALLAWKILNSRNHGFCLCSTEYVHRALNLKALSKPCPREFTPAGEYRCASVTLPVLWCEDTPLQTVMDQNKQKIQEDDEAWRLSNIFWGCFQRPGFGYYPVSHISRCTVEQGKFWLENHLVRWKFQNGLKEETWVVICISLTSLCASHTGWFNLIVNVNTSCAHYNIARDPWDDHTPQTGVPFLEAEWWPKPGGHVFPVRLSNDARACRVILPINVWHVVSAQHRHCWKNTSYTPLEHCMCAGAIGDESRSGAEKVALELCSGGSAPGIYEV
ncbi:hypothetical protein HBI31_204880 [Parastagonospora nodorum]|nr:hypothetical protein HBI31_204880 [Parastagonospora nodorum]